jgi:two-component system chemotaxis response regulator CheY
MPTILTLDDDTLFCEFIHDVLVQDGHSVVTAYNGEEGLGRLTRQTFDLVLTDIDMPIMDGLEFLRRARAMPCGLALPFILLTGRRREHVVAAGNPIEGVPFLQKPVTPGTISKTVRATLDDFARAREGLGGHRGGILQ